MKYTAETFLSTIKPYVIADMQKSGILASLTAAQALIESNKGNSGLTQKGNNLFGIKGSYAGQYVEMMTTEYYNGVAVRVKAKFRKYPSWAESIADHSALFNRLKRYENLRGCTDYIQACKNVQKDGYATSPTYSSVLINTCNQYRLYEWDREGGANVSPGSVITYPVLKLGDINEHVLAGQIFLNQNKFFCGREDGIFGRNTELAVREWQAAHGLIADGIIGVKTWATVASVIE